MHIQRWTRRHVLQSAVVAGVAPLALQRSLAGEADWSHDFARSLEYNPALLGWRSVQSDRLAYTARIEGRLPEALLGTFYRNGPAVHERFGLRYRHMFDGDGMVQAFRFDGHGVTRDAPPVAARDLGACRIKGNISHNSGRRIYHVPGDRDYERTRISQSRGERYFCTEAEARAAGWRRAGR